MTKEDKENIVRRFNLARASVINFGDSVSLKELESIKKSIKDNGYTLYRSCENGKFWILTCENFNKRNSDCVAIRERAYNIAVRVAGRITLYNIQKIYIARISDTKKYYTESICDELFFDIIEECISSCSTFERTDSLMEEVDRLKNEYEKTMYRYDNMED